MLEHSGVHYHVRQDELSRIVYRAGHPVQEGALDEKAFRDLVDWQIAEGTNGLVPVGTTGESPTLSHEEHERVVEWCVDQAKGRVPVIAGAGSNSTRKQSSSRATPRRRAPMPC